MSYRILDAGDAALTIEFGSVIDPALLAAVNALDAAIQRLQGAGELPGVIETFFMLSARRSGCRSGSSCP